jgi:hypothetical protein
MTDKTDFLTEYEALAAEIAKEARMADCYNTTGGALTYDATLN